MFCSRCGSEVTGKSKFCPSCGLDLLATTPVQAIATGQITELDIVREALSAEYEILEELGRGGMALVYRAKDRHLEREVAIKVLPFSLAFDAEFVERFQREARTAAQLEHPNIISIYRVGRAGRVIYFVMKFLRGGALSDVLAERRKLTPPEIRRLLLEAGSALGYAAQRGIVHRDIKPDNIMFDEFGQYLLTDFGIAKAASGQKLTGTGMSIGTPHYMSPEQARAQPIDGRSDIYSLGIVAYQCLAGVVPYDGEDSFSIGYKHITEPIPTPALVTSDERRLFDVIRRMLMKDPQDRFQTCEELIAALQGQPTAAPGTVRASAALAAVGAGASVSGGYPSPLPPAIASQPTTPLASVSAEPERRAIPRRVADRSVALRGGDGSRAWIWVVLAVLLGGAGASYYYFSHGFAPAATAAPPVPTPLATGPDAIDSAPSGLGTTEAAAGTAAPPSGTGARTTGTDTSGAGTGTATSPAGTTVPPSDTSGPLSRSSGVRRPTDSAGVPSAPPTADSGGIRVVGLPPRSTVLIDETPAVEAVTRLPAGRHVVAISAPQFNFYAETLTVRPGEIEELRPALTRLGAREGARMGQQVEAAAPTCETPGPGYNADGSCFDARPLPVAQTFVPLPAEVAGMPRPSILWVKVSAEGATLEVRRRLPSNSPAFERLARAYAASVEWKPATKDGQPVEAWTQWPFSPVRQ